MATSAEIVPTILTASPDQYQKLFTAFASFAKRIQLDISDGQFAPNPTIPENSITALPENIAVDMHMMVARPSEHLEKLLALKPNLVIFHAETGEDLLPLFTKLHAANIKCGVALAKQTYPGRARAFIEAADHVLVFGGDLGHQGASADMLQVEKVPIITKIKPDVELGWDGGANMKNVRALARAGMNVINVGSAISNAPNPAEMYAALQKETEKHGVAL